MVIARWEGALDLQRARGILGGEPPLPADVPEPLVYVASADVP